MYELHRTGLDIALELLSSASKQCSAFAVEALLAVVIDACLAPRHADKSHAQSTAAAEDRAVVEVASDKWMAALASMFAAAVSKHRGTVDVPSLEKASIVLQKLSRRRYADKSVCAAARPHHTSRSSPALFERHNMRFTLKEALSVLGGEHAFLALNLRSILLNLDEACK